MVLLVNVFLHDGGATHYQRGHYPTPDMWDIYRYTLASYSAIPYWSRAIVNTRLAERYRGREAELTSYIQNLFPNIPLEINYTRNERIPQWRDLTRHLLETGEKLVWYACNHDHPFIDYDLKNLERQMEYLLSESEPASCYYSHFPEVARSMQKRGPIEVMADGTIRGYFDHMDSIQLVTTDLLHSWWHEVIQHPDDKYLPRSDWDDVWKAPRFRCYLPGRELCRHFDGYSHIFDIKDVPPYFIPEGFFEKDNGPKYALRGRIKIRFGYPDRKEGWTNITPTATEWRSSHSDGMDLRCMPNDIPLFWRNRISDWDVDERPEHCTTQDITQARNNAYRQYLTSPTDHQEYAGIQPPEAWVQGSMR